MEDSQKSDDLPIQDSTDDSLRKVSRDRIRSTPTYSAGPSNSAGNSSVGPSDDKDLISDSLTSLNITADKSKSNSSSRGTFAAIPSLSTDTEPMPSSAANSTTCLLPPKAFIIAGDFLFKAYSPTPDNSQELPEDPTVPIVEKELTESSYDVMAYQDSQNDELKICEPEPTYEKLLESSDKKEEKLCPKKDVISKPKESPREKRSPRPYRSPPVNRSPKARPTTKDGSSPKAGPSQAGPSRAGPSQAGPSHAGPSQAGPSQAGPSKAEPSRRRSSDFSSSDDDVAGVSPKKPRDASKLFIRKVQDPLTAQIRPNQDSTIDIKTRYEVLGLAILGGKDTAVNGPAAIVQDIYNDGVIVKDGRLKIGDQIKECNEVQFTEEMDYERLAMTIKQHTHMLNLVVYRPDPIPYKEFIVELTRKPGEPLGLVFRPPTSGKGVYFCDPTPGTTVERDGRIKYGDILLSVDDVDLETSDFMTVSITLKLIADKAVIKLRRFMIVQ